MLDFARCAIRSAIRSVIDTMTVKYRGPMGALLGIYQSKSDGCHCHTFRFSDWL